MDRKLFTLLFGPTGSGKTAYALQWANQTGGNLLSVDSRQIYQDMNIVVGKDIPAGAKWVASPVEAYSAWQMKNKSFIFGLDIVPPSQIFTISHWYRWAAPVISWHRENNVPLLMVGGTWPWHSVLLDPPESLFVLPNEKWRAAASNMNLEELQNKLQSEHPEKWSEMNESDRGNQRRLVRAIEVAQASDIEKPATLISSEESEILLRSADLNDLTGNIHTRVLERWENGALQETKVLMEKYRDWSVPAFSATGYQNIRAFLENKISEEQAIRNWVHEERQYAKRQLTWLKKVQTIHAYQFV